MRVPQAATAALDPSREEARRWAQLELADPVYAQARPGLVQRALEWLLERLRDLEVPDQVVPGSRLGMALLVGVLALIALVVLRRVGTLRTGAAAGAGDDLFVGTRRTAAEHRSIADRAATGGDWELAVRERFRAVVRDLEERTVLDVVRDPTAGRSGD